MSELIVNIIIRFVCFFFCCLAGYNSLAQTCTTLGQTPGSAFPVCGTAKFEQKEVPLCGGRALPSFCPSAAITDVNPFWYKFTANTSGTLGFVITPVTLNEDYDWQLFDITGKNPDDVFTTSSLVIAHNWSGEFGVTGASTAGSSLTVCEGPGKPLFSSMPSIKAGHTYLLLISHFTNSQSGYSLEFKGGTASIYDPLEPAVAAIRAACSGKELSLVFNKKMRCSTLSEDGSEIVITDGNGTKAITANSLQCLAGFDMDSVTVTLDNNLAPGKYHLSIKDGSDGNSILDYCERPVNSAQSFEFEVPVVSYTPLDSLVTPLCAPSSVTLVFDNRIKCSSLTSNASEFKVSGPGPVTINGFTANCQNDLTSSIQLNFTAPLVIGGTYTIQLFKGSDGNTIINECGLETPEGESISFTIKDTVSADFSINQFKGCRADTFALGHDGAHGVDSWNWSFPDATGSALQNPVFISPSSGSSFIRLIVSNGLCSDTATQQIVSDTRLDAVINGPSVICPRDGGLFTDASIGSVISWNWSFGNGSTSSVQNPPLQNYGTQSRDVEENVQLIVRDNIGCEDTAIKKILIVSSCIIVVPNAFTPNNDGRNDFLFPSNGYKADNLIFRVFNRFGQLVFETRDWTRKWDGRYNGQELATGTYVWTLQYTLRDTGQRYSLKGTTTLLR